MDELERFRESCMDIRHQLERRAEACGRAEAEHGHGSPAHREAVGEWNEYLQRVTELAEELNDIVYTIDDAKNEYGLGE